MKAASTPTYGPANVLEILEVAIPTLADDEVLVEVHASVVTAGDRRLRAADFPSFTAVIGRLMFGVLRPRNPIQGTMFAGRVVEIGRAVTRYAVGDDVFGSVDHGAYAQYLSIGQDGPMAEIPTGSSYEEAAATPYGAVTALRFLRDLGAVAPGDAVLIVGASGGVGRFAVELAKHMGAEVTAVCSQRHFSLVRELGADHVIDYAAEDFTQNGLRYDVIFDIADATSFGRSRGSLTEKGRYLTLSLSVGALLNMGLTSLTGGRQAKFGIAIGDREITQEIRELMERGVVRPVIGGRFSFDEIAQAHAQVEAGRLRGCAVVTVVPAQRLRVAS